MLSATDPATLRAEIARSGLRAYQVAALVERHPANLSRLLRGHAPIPEKLGRRILEVVQAARPREFRRAVPES